MYILHSVTELGQLFVQKQMQWFLEHFFALNPVVAFIFTTLGTKPHKMDLNSAKMLFLAFLTPTPRGGGHWGVKTKYANLSLFSRTFR